MRGPANQRGWRVTSTSGSSAQAPRPTASLTAKPELHDIDNGGAPVSASGIKFGMQPAATDRR